MTSKSAAIRYARALFDVALAEKSDLDRVTQELAGVNDLFERQPTLRKVMLNPAVPVPRKRAAMTELTTIAKTSPMVTKLLQLLAERDRLIILPDLALAFRDRLNAHRKVVRAEVTTATPLPTDKAQVIETRLAQVTGRTVQMSTKVDPRIIGGLVAKVGSTVYDASVTRQLEKMKQRLVEST
jgi:F-type H+-transporting ATPase subunit delta